MDLRDFGRAIARGWLPIVLALVVGGAAAWAYLAYVPKEYDATATVVLVANSTTMAEAQQGVAFSSAAASTAATIIDSPAVLDGVDAGSLTTEELVLMTTAAARTGTSTIDITVRSTDPAVAASVANAAADAATTVIPGILGVVATDQSAATARVEVIRPAVAPTDPATPDSRGVIVISLSIALLVGLAIAIAREALRMTRTAKPRRANERKA